MFLTNAHHDDYARNFTIFKFARPKSTLIYTRSIEAVLTTEYNKDGDDDHEISKAGLPEVDISSCNIILHRVSLHHKWRADHGYEFTYYKSTILF